MLCLPNKTLLYSYAFHFMLTCANAYGLLGFIKHDVTKRHVMQRHITLAQGLDGYDNPHYMKYYEQTCRVDFDPQSLAAPPYAVYNNMKVSSDSDTSDSDTTDTTGSDARMQSSCFCFHDPDNADHQPPFPASLGWPAYAPYTRRRRHGQGNATAAPAAAAGANGRPLKWFGKTPIVGVYTHQGEDRLWTSIPDSLSGGEDVAGGEMHSRSDSDWVEWDHFCDAFADELMSLNASSSSSSFANERSSSSTSTNTAGSSRSNEIILEHVANGTSGVECKALCEAATTASIRNGGRQRWCEAFVATEAGECFLLQKLVYLSADPRNANSLVYANASMLLDDGWTFDAADVDVDFAVDDGTDGTDSVRACRLDACTVDGILDPSCCAGGASSKRTAGCETMSRYAQMDGTRLPHAYL